MRGFLVYEVEGVIRMAEKEVVGNVSEINDADAASIRVNTNSAPKGGNYGSVSVNETGKVEAPPANTDQV